MLLTCSALLPVHAASASAFIRASSAALCSATARFASWSDLAFLYSFSAAGRSASIAYTRVSSAPSCQSTYHQSLLSCRMRAQKCNLLCALSRPQRLLRVRLNLVQDFPQL